MASKLHIADGGSIADTSDNEILVDLKPAIVVKDSGDPPSPFLSSKSLPFCAAILTPNKLSSS